MKRTQVIIAINLEEYIRDRGDALDEADAVAKEIKETMGYNAYGIDADVVEVDE